MDVTAKPIFDEEALELTIPFEGTTLPELCTISGLVLNNEDSLYFQSGPAVVDNDLGTVTVPVVYNDTANPGLDSGQFGFCPFPGAEQLTPALETPPIYGPNYDRCLFTGRNDFNVAA